MLPRWETEPGWVGLARFTIPPAAFAATSLCTREAFLCLDGHDWPFLCHWVRIASWPLPGVARQPRSKVANNAYSLQRVLGAAARRLTFGEWRYYNNPRKKTEEGSKMLLVIAIGSSNIRIGIYEGRSLRMQTSIHLPDNP